MTQDKKYNLKYYLTAGSVMIAELVFLQLFRWLNADDPPTSSDGMVWFMAPSLYFLSLPGAFLFWIYALRGEHRFTLTFSLPACLASVLFFTLAAGLNADMYHAYVTAFAGLACVAAAFVFIPWRTFARHAFRDRRLACVALIGASASAGYSLMDSYMWERMAHSAASASSFLLQLLGIDSDIGIKRQLGDIATILSSDYFTVLVYRPCSGLEGIFLFIFLLSLALLLDWPLFKKLHLIETYLVGFIFMYAANVLRIVSLFLLGHFAHAPDAGSLLASMRGLPVHIFHSFAGQIYYLLAFMLFAHLMYAYASPPAAEKKRD